MEEVVEEKEVETKEEVKEVNVEELAGVDLDVNIGELSKDEPVEEKPKEEKVGAKPEEKKEEKKEPEIDSRFKEMESRMTRLEADKRDLQKALHEARQDKKKTKEAEASLSYEELQKIVKEHKDNPEVLLNAAAYYAKNLIRETKKDTVNEVEINNKKADLEKVLRSRIKDFDDENSQARQLINSTKEAFHIADHPFSDYLSAAVAVYSNLDQIREMFMEQGKQKVVAEQAEEKRKSSIKSTQAGPGGTKSSSSGGDRDLSPTELETAKRLGFTTPAKLKLYRSQILKNVAPAK